MPAPITVVIPTLNAASALPETAGALMPGVEAGLIGTLVVSDGGSNDDTLGIAKGLGARIVTGPSGRGAQIARGVAEARSDWLLILHADTHLSGDWVDALRHHLAHEVDRAGYFRLAYRAPGLTPRLVAGWANLRSRWLGLPYGDQALLIHHATLDAVGGIPDLPLMEDVALTRALKGRLRVLPATARTSAERYLEEGWLMRGARNLWTLARYLGGADPAVLARSYKRKTR